LDVTRLFTLHPKTIQRDPSATPSILFYSGRHARQGLDVTLPGDLADRTFGDCPGECELLIGDQYLARADAVVFHIPTLDDPFTLSKPRSQVWIAFSMESDVNYPRLRDPSFMAAFDYTMTYRRDSDIPRGYFGTWLPPLLLQPARPKDATAPAVYFASSGYNQSRRHNYVRALMRLMGVHSYGKVLRNRQLDHDEGRRTKLATIARYKFTLAFENSITRDYVTEKLCDPLIAGSVPVYLGAPNVEEFAPGDHCYINVADYHGPKHLAEYLLRLDAQPEKYDEYLAWKQKELRPNFLEMIQSQSPSATCQLCALLRARLQE
jgi:Glycosyltransferase family 10 (fucosyltransferase) C-term/Fucosyltransferase, N-terminal